MTGAVPSVRLGVPLGVEAADAAEVERIVRGAGTSFYRGMRILPADRRLAMYGIYAFCRVVDDIADEPAPLAQQRSGLAAWRDRVRGLHAGAADDPVTRVLRAAAGCFDLRTEDMLAVVDGMEMDAEADIVAPALDTLMLYCDRVAGAVGRLSVRAFGDRSADAAEVAEALGRATPRCRQCGSGWRGRRPASSSGRARRWNGATGRRCGRPG